jgi:uncharacterized OB-fold protein
LTHFETQNYNKAKTVPIDDNLEGCQLFGMLPDIKREEMAIIHCKECGYTLKVSNGACPNCGSNNRDIAVEDWGHGKDEVKIFVVELQERIGVKPNVDTAVTQALLEEERGFWKKFINFLKDNIVIEGLEIGFPSGVKVILRPRRKDKYG